MLSNTKSGKCDQETDSKKTELSIKSKPDIPTKPINIPTNRFIVRNKTDKNIVSNENPKTKSLMPITKDILTLPHSSSPDTTNECCGIILSTGISLPERSLDQTTLPAKSKFDNKCEKKCALSTLDARKINKSIHENDQYKQSSKQLEYLLTQNLESNNIKKPTEYIKYNKAIIKNQEECKLTFNEMYSANKLSSELHNEIHQQFKNIQEKLGVEKRLPQCCAKTLSDTKTHISESNAQTNVS